MAVSGYGGTDPNKSPLSGKNITPQSANSSQSPFTGKPTGQKPSQFYGLRGGNSGSAVGGAVNPSTDPGYGGYGGSQTGIVPRLPGQPGAGGGAGQDTGGPGTESGPGILEQWFNQRVNGIDQGYQYALDRGTQNINNEAAARGGYNSGATMRQIGDFSANLGSQRQAQLDALAGGASGEHQRRLEDMFGQGSALASGQSGLAGQYDVASGASQATLQNALVQLLLNKGGVNSANSQSIIQNLMSLYALA